MPSTAHKLARALAAPPPKAPKSPPFIMGSVAAVSSATSPPSVSVTMNGDPTVIAGVSFLDSYSPVVGDNVILSKQGTSLIILGSVAGAAPLGLYGPGSNSSSASSGGGPRADTKPFLYTINTVVTTSGSAWSFTTTGVTFNGVGYYCATPGALTANGGSLLCLQMNQPTISGGNLTISGVAVVSVGGGTGQIAGASSGLIRINIAAVGW